MVCVPCDGLVTRPVFLTVQPLSRGLLGQRPDSDLIRIKWWLAENKWVMLCITMVLHKVLQTEEATIDFQPDFTVFSLLLLSSQQTHFQMLLAAVPKSQTAASVICLMPSSRWSGSALLCVKYLVKSWLIPSGTSEYMGLNAVILEVFASPVDSSEFKNGL